MTWTVFVRFRSYSEINIRKSSSIGCIFSIVVEPGANTVAIESAVKERINGAQVEGQHGKELAFLLPSSESDKFRGKICYTN